MDSQAAYPGCWGVAVALACVCCAAYGQTAQKGADVSRRTKEKLRVDYIGYRAARYETEAVVEPQNGRPNRGGFIRVYLTNTSGKDLQLAYYRCNGKDVSHWLLNGYFAWDRLYNQHLNPGQTTVLEINAVTGDFGAGQPFSFAYIDRSWLPACFREAILAEDPVQISLVRMLPGLRELEVHVRHTGGRRVVLGAVQVLGRNTEHLVWAGATHSVALKGPSYAIARIRLDHPLAAADLAVLRLSVEEDGDVRQIYAHRRAFEDWFPIGCWSAEPDTYGPLRRHHIELVVRGGRADHEFYSDIAPKYGFRTMCPTGAFDGLDTIRSLADHPAVACWMLADEPDWSTPPVVMMHSDAFARRNNRTKPTFITLCRNVKFFEYGPIADIPCMDHYCVTAPTSSKWPEPYGTRLEETAYYTRDLKTACEPKPIWVWSQAIASWDERPR
ncbi:MAG: hypothetical protein JXR94_12845, partial [Candidatus Hydrogenedentes bacterium]|nr:hypothetical protein [Candidatus Hydrogenedentota bacterium]